MNIVRGLLVASFLMVQQSQAQQDVPVLAQHVMDFTNSLTFNEWRSLEDRLNRVKDTTHVHIAILVVETVPGEALSGYAERVFRQNRLGSDERTPGILIVVEKNSKSAVIELGTATEKAIQNDVAAVILEKEILPLLKSDNFYGGLAAGVLAITDAVVGKYEMPAETSTSVVIILLGVIIALAVAGVIVSRVRKKKGANA